LPLELLDLRKLEQFQHDLKVLGTGGVRRIVLKVVQTAGLSAQAKAQAAVTGGNPLHTRSGRLRQSIGYRVQDQTNAVLLHLYAGGGGRGEVKYAASHEYGATIRPVRGKFLAIPVGPALTGAGVARFSPRDLQLRFIATRSGGILVLKTEQRTAGGRLKRGGAVGTPYFVLVREVTIPKRPYLRPALEDAAHKLGPELAQHVRTAVLGGGR
jgi:hypothetical protein